MKKILTALILSLTMTAHAAPTTIVFIQHAKSAELTQQADQSYILTLHQPSNFVSYFSDRPERLTGIIPQSKFVQLWSKQNKAKFAEVPPNIALESEKINVVGTLQNPQISKNGDLSYKFKPLKADIKMQAKQNLGYTVLFIDDVHWDPGGFGDGG